MFLFFEGGCLRLIYKMYFCLCYTIVYGIDLRLWIWQSSELTQAVLLGRGCVDLALGYTVHIT